jgi:hypothetical protein
MNEFTPQPLMVTAAAHASMARTDRDLFR